MAEAVFRQLVAEAGLEERFEIASGATSRWELGKPPHPGTQAVLRSHKVPLDPRKRAEQITSADFYYYDYIVPMDQENLADMARFPKEKVRLLMDYAPGKPRDVPDPYYTNNFEYVYDLVRAGSQGLLDAIRLKEGL
jgi:protein-tyrosine phosphatase